MFVASKRSIDVIVVVRIGNLSQGFEDWQDPRSTGGTSGLAITSDWLTRPLELKSDARYVVVVEKDGVFNRLVEDRFYDRCKKIRCAECCLLTPGPNDAAGNQLNLSGGTGRERERQIETEVPESGSFVALTYRRRTCLIEASLKRLMIHPLSPDVQPPQTSNMQANAPNRERLVTYKLRIITLSLRLQLPLTSNFIPQDPERAGDGARVPTPGGSRVRVPTSRGSRPTRSGAG